MSLLSLVQYPIKGIFLNVGIKKRQQFNQLRKNHCQNKRKLFKIQIIYPL